MMNNEQMRRSLYEVSPINRQPLPYHQFNYSGIIPEPLNMEISTLPGTLCYSQVLVTSSRVYLLERYSDRIYSAPTDDNGVIGEWVLESNTLPGVLEASRAIVTSDRVYLLKGYNRNGSASSIYSAPIDSDGIIGEWVIEENALPEPLYDSQLVATSSRVYLLGGFNNCRIDSIYSASIRQDGTLGKWVTESNRLPEPLYDSQVITTSSRVYLLGGHNNIGYTNKIYSAPINSDGTLGEWVIESSTLPQSSLGSKVVVINGKVYMLGGFSGSGISPVYSSTINSDGTLSTWVTETNTLPGILCVSHAVVTNGKVYVLDAYNNIGPVSRVYSTSVNNDGTLGGWVIDTVILSGTLHTPYR